MLVLMAGATLVFAFFKRDVLGLVPLLLSTTFWYTLKQQTDKRNKRNNSHCIQLASSVYHNGSGRSSGSQLVLYHLLLLKPVRSKLLYPLSLFK